MKIYKCDKCGVEFKPGEGCIGVEWESLDEGETLKDFCRKHDLERIRLLNQIDRVKKIALNNWLNAEKNEDKEEVLDETIQTKHTD